MNAHSISEQPIYRWYLAGGPQSLHLPWNAASLVFALGLGTRLANMAGAGGGAADVLDMLISAGGAALVAAFTARWLGARKGLWAGIGIAASLWTFQACRPLDRLGVVLMWAGLAAFAWANVPGRLAPFPGRWLRAGFWALLAFLLALTGPVGPCYVAAICALYLVAAQDSRGARFLLDVRGLAFLIAAIACLETARHFGLTLPSAALAVGSGGGLPGSLAMALVKAGLPWVPLALPGLWIVARQGHCFLPIWRLLACWTVVPLALLGAGLFRSSACLAALLPPLAALAAVGFDEGLHGLRRLGWIKRRPARATA